jgi:P-type Cu+ transporter
MKTATGQATICYHCGQDCRDDLVEFDNKNFCCNGCKAVYGILSEARLDAYYRKNEAPGVRPARISAGRFEYLDNIEVCEKLLEYSDENKARVSFFIPQIHCSSCIWLLEHLYLLESGIQQATASLPRRRLTLIFDKETTSLRKIVELLASLGYEPKITLDDIGKPKSQKRDWSLYAKIGVAGFSFANIMLFSFPEYLSRHGISDSHLSITFRYASLLLALPVLIYSAGDYFRHAWIGLRGRFINLNVPLALGIGMLFFRSLYDIVSGTGPGYLDSFAGLVFFLLLGRLFQQKSFEKLSFDRDYKSYFPISCVMKTKDGESTVPITRLRPGNRIVVRNQEIIPADSILISGEAAIDYSFVTGESQPQNPVSGQRVYAGGRQLGGALELDVICEVSESYLISLWSDQRLVTPVKGNTTTLTNTISKYFTAAVLGIAGITAIYWFNNDPSKLALAVTSILVVACPCALALASPFVLGTAARIWGNNRFFVRKPEIIEELFYINKIIFDKTGTLTHIDKQIVSWHGEFSEYEKSLIASIAKQSTHPASRLLASSLSDYQTSNVAVYQELPGKGIQGSVDTHMIKIGAASWLTKNDNDVVEKSTPRSYVTIDDRICGYFQFETALRDGLDETFAQLNSRYNLVVLTGDSNVSSESLQSLVGVETPVATGQSPFDKLDYLEKQREHGIRTIMIGDGLNDSGALRAATVGIAVTDDISSFTPGCDGIIDAEKLGTLDRFLSMARKCRKIIISAFILSLLYNIIGLGFAASGHLSPLVSAILMPISSVSVILFSTIVTRMAARKAGIR